MVVMLILIPMAATSTTGIVKRLGPKRWQALHRFVYLAVIGGVFHFFMMVKADWREPALYALILSFLLGWRIWRRLRRA